MSSDKNGYQSFSLMVTKLPQGGFVVTDSPGREGFYVAQLFASTTIEEALKFIKTKLKD